MKRFIVLLGLVVWVVFIGCFSSWQFMHPFRKSFVLPDVVFSIENMGEVFHITSKADEIIINTSLGAVTTRNFDRKGVPQKLWFMDKGKDVMAMDKSSGSFAVRRDTSVEWQVRFDTTGISYIFSQFRKITPFISLTDSHEVVAKNIEQVMLILNVKWIMHSGLPCDFQVVHPSHADTVELFRCGTENTFLKYKEHLLILRHIRGRAGLKEVILFHQGKKIFHSDEIGKLEALRRSLRSGEIVHDVVWVRVHSVSYYLTEWQFWKEWGGQWFQKILVENVTGLISYLHEVAGR